MDKLTASLDERFARLHANSCALIRVVPPAKLYWQPHAATDAAANISPLPSCGEHILRSAAAVEQTFGGITANLWDDPFEWALPESLATPARIEEYLFETEATRLRGFALLKSDGELLKEIALPSGEIQMLFALLAETLVRAAHHQGRAFATFRLFSDLRFPRI